jgi:hypothetical protein
MHCTEGRSFVIGLSDAVGDAWARHLDRTCDELELIFCCVFELKEWDSC